MKKDTFALLASNIFNPFLVSVIVLAVLAVEATASFNETLRWLGITLAISVVPVIIFVYILIRLKKLDNFFSNPKEQRNIIYLSATILGSVDCALLWYFAVPKPLAVIFTAGLIGVICFLIINYFWKISLHTAFVAAAVTVMLFVYGTGAVWSSLIVPLVGWSRIVLKQHNVLQVAAGGLLAIAIICGVFWGFGIA
jgi:membrane-associated phospholipid phosphatase